MQDPPWWEILVLAAVGMLSAGVFTQRVLHVSRRILAARPDPDFKWGSIPARAARVFSEVLLQSKVIRERPLPGLAHALVFWGFCAFALITVNHVAAGFGVRLLDREGAFGGFYFHLAAAFAVAVSAGITGLAVRRFVARPRWLGEVSMESGLIALLILALMLTYLAEYRMGETAGELWSRVIWWSHTLALAWMLPLIPHTKHMHLLLGPLAVFLERPRFSDIPPLVGEDDFGLVSGADVTRLTALQAYSCVECGRCTEHCPAYNTGKELNPKQIILGIRAHLDEFGSAAAPPLLGAHVSQEAAFQCTTCGACEYQCPVGIQHLPAIIGLRRGAVNTGVWADDYGTKLFLNLERYGNPLGLSASERDKFIEKAQLPLFDGSQEYCLWLGCMGSYDPRGREIVQSLARVLNHLEVTYGVLKKERCTGDSARRLGNDLAFGELAAANREALESAKVGKLLSICPHCVRTMREDWREFGGAPPVEHHSEFLARHAGQWNSGAPSGGSVTFHDPCYLGRYQEIYDAPRRVAALAGALIEPERSRSRSFCCGAGGGLAFLGEESGQRVSANRAKELLGTGAGAIAAACPFCSTMLGDALKSEGGSAPRLWDIAEIAAAKLPEKTR
jgi:Fe-S oxidoreductase